MDENKLLERITASPIIFGGKPVIRGPVLLWSTSWGCWQGSRGYSRNDSEKIALAANGRHSGMPGLFPQDGQP
jgi:hypothetical protein